MIAGLMDLGRPLLLALDAETAHGVAIRALAAGVHPRCRRRDDPRLQRRIWDLDFSNPVGMAAGFDKNGEVPDALLACGFGFVEIGTVTPRPQAGNPRPRLFRLPQDRAVINRMGFNNDGHRAVLSRLGKRRRRGIVGVNIGANKDSADRIGDYVAGVTAFAPVADYLTVNVSSPNTPGLRALQAADTLGELLGAVMAARNGVADEGGRKVPVLLKIAPDLRDEEVAALVATAMEGGIDGMIVSNTTTAREGLSERRSAREAGGLSGRPLFNRSTRMLARVRQAAGPELPLIGVGGIDSPQAAWEKITAGADLVQLYTGLVYEGFGLVERIKREFLRRIEREGHRDLAAAVGTASRDWAEREF